MKMTLGGHNGTHSQAGNSTSTVQLGECLIVHKQGTINTHPEIATVCLREMLFLHKAVCRDSRVSVPRTGAYPTSITTVMLSDQGPVRNREAQRHGGTHHDHHPGALQQAHLCRPGFDFLHRHSSGVPALRPQLAGTTLFPPCATGLVTRTWESEGGALSLCPLSPSSAKPQWRRGASANQRPRTPWDSGRRSREWVSECQGRMQRNARHGPGLI